MALLAQVQHTHRYTSCQHNFIQSRIRCSTCINWWREQCKLRLLAQPFSASNRWPPPTRILSLRHSLHKSTTLSACSRQVNQGPCLCADLQQGRAKCVEPPPRRHEAVDISRGRTSARSQVWCTGCGHRQSSADVCGMGWCRTVPDLIYVSSTFQLEVSSAGHAHLT